MSAPASVYSWAAGQVHRHAAGELTSPKISRYPRRRGNRMSAWARTMAEQEIHLDPTIRGVQATSGRKLRP